MNEVLPAARPVALIILDGWGIADASPGNAVSLADTPTFDRLWSEQPHTMLSASGTDVGVRPGQFGNSEVGHLNIGAGFIVNQAIRQIDVAIENGEFQENPALLAAIRNAKQRGRPLHLMGLLSDGGVHSHIDHLLAILELARAEGLGDVAIHAFLDGRDTSPTGGKDYLRRVQQSCRELGVGRIASVVGRYFAMDRDRHWARTEVAFDLLVDGLGETTTNPVAAVLQHYDDGVTDEFMVPIKVGDGSTISDGDSVIFFNFRADRARQIVQALNGPDVNDQERFGSRPKDLFFVGLLPYADFLSIDYAFEPVSVNTPLACVVSNAGLSQFHTAETEKYAHVTYFINGGREKPFPRENRLMVQSPDVATYDLQPEMSAAAVARGAAEAIESGDYDLTIVNFANPDMVGHTGDLDAAIAACEAVDRQLALLVNAIERAGGIALIIADHGNAEQMYVDGSTDPMTAHTTNPVPCILAGYATDTMKLRNGGILADVAPTLLQLLGLEPAPDMTRTSLIAK
jgi:2,3-bisphosphoglycerate-independent phosphoglycerate mutase